MAGTMLFERWKRGYNYGIYQYGIYIMKPQMNYGINIMIMEYIKYNSGIYIMKPSMNYGIFDIIILI